MMLEILAANWMIFYGSLLSLQRPQVSTSAIEHSTLSQPFSLHLIFCGPVLTVSSNYAQS